MPLYLGSKTVSENINMGDTVIQNTFDLFDVKWSDHIINNESWMCADDFNWIDGSVFSAAWNELKSEWDLATIDSTPAQQDVIGNITINYWKSPKGYKLVEYGGDTPETNENLLQQLYDEVGIAWYYLIDTTGQIRFKLPRTKYGFVGVRSGAGNFVDESLPNIKGQYESIQLNADGVSGAFYAGSNIRYKPTHTDLSTGMGLGLDASRSSSTYQDGANVQQKSTEMHLYFYLADFVRTPLESNLNTFITETKEALNEKVNISDYSADKTNMAKLDENNTFTGFNTFGEIIPDSINFKNKAGGGNYGFLYQNTAGYLFLGLRNSNNTEFQNNFSFLPDGSIQVNFGNSATNKSFTVPTPATTDNSTKAATTAWVNKKHQVVSVLPANPDPNTFYYIPEE